MRSTRSRVRDWKKSAIQKSNKQNISSSMAKKERPVFLFVAVLSIIHLL